MCACLCVLYVTSFNFTQRGYVYRAVASSNRSQQVTTGMQLLAVVRGVWVDFSSRELIKSLKLA